MRDLWHEQGIPILEEKEEGISGEQSKNNRPFKLNLLV